MEQVPRQEKRRALSGAIRLAVAYFTITTIWIFGSDHLAVLIAADTGQLRFIQTVKGMLFVTLMAILVGVYAARLLLAEAARQRAQVLASTDLVTRLPNALAFHTALVKALSHEEFRGGLLLIDVRDFSRINTSFGRAAGDQALFNIGKRLGALAGENDHVARMEEDKFALLLVDTTAEQVTDFAETVLAWFRSEIRVGGHSLPLDLNIGYAIIPDDGDNVAAFLDAADLALRAAKQAGHNIALRFQHAQQQSRRETFHLESELRQALTQGALALHLQPQYELASNTMVSAEALVRWTHPQRGDISPAVFIPVAEQSGLIDRIGEFVLNEAFRVMCDWREARLPALRIAVNISGHQLDDQRLAIYLVQAAEKWKLPLSMLEIEITETMAMRNPDHAIELLSQLRELGITIALDDFGTGYSSLSYLLQLPVDKLKIDRSFIAGLQQHRQRSFVRTLIGLGRDLGTRVVAEGIETAVQRELLLELGCDLGQGYLLGHPMSVEDFTAVLKTARTARIG